MGRRRKVVPEVYWLESKGAWHVNLDGRKVWLGKDRDRADQKFKELLADRLQSQADAARVGAVPKPAGLTLAKAVDLYTSHARETVGESQLTRIQMALDPVIEQYGNRPVASFGRDEFLKVREQLLSGGSRRRPGKIVERLAELLRGGPRLSTEVNAVLFALGHKESAVNQARRVLGVTCYKEGADWYQRVDPARAAQVSTWKPLSRRYVGHLEGCIKTAWRWMADHNLVARPVADVILGVPRMGAGKGAAEPPPRFPVTSAVVDKTLPELGTTVRALIQVIRLTGARPGEICRMRPCDVSRSPDQMLAVPVGDGHVFVSAQEVDGATAWVYVPKRHKNTHRGKPRLVAIGPQAQEVLKPLLDVAAPEGPVFPTGVGKGAYTPHALKKALSRACKRAKVPAWTPYQLRHGAATSIGNSDHGLDGVRAVLGNTPQMAQHYVGDLLAKAARVMLQSG